MTNRINYILIIGVCLSVGLFITHIIGSSHAAQENTSGEQTNDVAAFQAGNRFFDRGNISFTPLKRYRIERGQ